MGEKNDNSNLRGQVKNGVNGIVKKTIFAVGLTILFILGFGAGIFLIRFTANNDEPFLNGDTSVYFTILSIAFSVTLITTSLLSILSSKEDHIYWTLYSEEFLIKPKITNFYTLSTISFCTLFSAFFAALFRFECLFLGSFITCVIAIVFLDYKFLNVHFFRERCKEKLEKRFLRYTKAEQIGSEEQITLREMIVRLENNLLNALKSGNNLERDEDLFFALGHITNTETGKLCKTWLTDMVMSVFYKAMNYDSDLVLKTVYKIREKEEFVTNNALWHKYICCLNNKEMIDIADVKRVLSQDYEFIKKTMKHSIDEIYNSYNDCADKGFSEEWGWDPETQANLYDWTQRMDSAVRFYANLYAWSSFDKGIMDLLDFLVKDRDNRSVFANGDGDPEGDIVILISLCEVVLKENKEMLPKLITQMTYLTRKDRLFLGGGEGDLYKKFIKKGAEFETERLFEYLFRTRDELFALGADEAKQVRELLNNLIITRNGHFTSVSRISDDYFTNLGENQEYLDELLQRINAMCDDCYELIDMDYNREDDEPTYWKEAEEIYTTVKSFSMIFWEKYVQTAVIKSEHVFALLVSILDKEQDLRKQFIREQVKRDTK